MELPVEMSASMGCGVAIARRFSNLYSLVGLSVLYCELSGGRS